jgi:hypothetical protein
MPRLADPIGITTPVVTPAMLDVMTFVPGRAITNPVGVPTDDVMELPLTVIIAPPSMVAPATVPVTTCVPAIILASDVVCDENPPSEKAANPNII